MSTMFGAEDTNEAKRESPDEIARKKSLIMTLGNAKDITGLLDLLESEDEELVLVQIILTLGALGKPRAIKPLQQLIKHTDNKTVSDRAQEAIEVIHSLSQYTNE